MLNKTWRPEGLDFTKDEVLDYKWKKEHGKKISHLI